MKIRFTDVMVDIETLDTEPTAVILSIGAVPFHIVTGEMGDYYYSKCNVSMQIRDGHTISTETLAWWIKNDHETLLEYLNGGEWVRRAVEGLIDFIEEQCNEDACIWANSPSFDLVKLKNALGNPWPFGFWNERDVRTLINLRPEIAKMFKTPVSHHPVEDCENQIRQVCPVYWDLNGITKC